MGRAHLGQGSPLLRSKLFSVFVLAGSLGFSLSYLFFSATGWPRVLQIDGLLSMALHRSLMTLVLLSFSYLIFYMGFFGLARLFADRKLLRGLNHFIAPSASLVAFALLFFIKDSSLKLLGFILGSFWMFFPVIYKMRWSGRMNELSSQVSVAQLMGANDQLIFSQVLWPQLKPMAHMLALLGGIFTAGDFAFSKVFLDGNETLALLIESLMSSYRIEAAIALSSLLVLLPIPVSSILKKLL